MSSFTKDELTVLLGYYYFESSKNDNKLFQNFVILFNDSYKKNVSPQVINYQLTLFKSVDSSHNANFASTIDSPIVDLWNYYVLQERIDLLKKKYKSFKNKEITHKETLIFGDDNQALIEINKHIADAAFTFIEDRPKKLYDAKSTEKSVTIRDAQVSLNALKIADYKCECSCNHELFIRKDGLHTYTEGHHLIPLEFQEKYDVNLDVEANVVSLCSSCHNHLHYGQNPSELLKKLFTSERQKRLAKCGINITLDELIKLYK